MSNDFDRYRDSYGDEVQRSIDFSGQDVAFFTDVKADILVRLARRRIADPTTLAVLDVGCGVGLTDAALGRRFGSIHGVDVSEGSVATASAANPWASYQGYDGSSLPFEDERFDLAFAICVVHHVDPPDRAAFVAEVTRVLRPGGLLAIVEHNPFNPLTRIAVDRCAFDEGVVLSSRGRTRGLLRGAGLAIVDDPYILFFPWRVGVLRQVERALTWLPLGAQYVVAGRKGGAEGRPS